MYKITILSHPLIIVIVILTRSIARMVGKTKESNRWFKSLFLLPIIRNYQEKLIFRRIRTAGKKDKGKETCGKSLLSLSPSVKGNEKNVTYCNSTFVKVDKSLYNAISLTNSVFKINTKFSQCSRSWDRRYICVALITLEI